MFLRKLFSGQNKLSWVVIDLAIVIIGVYSASLMQDYSDRKRNELEKDKVMTALKLELETFRVQLPVFADYIDNYYQTIAGKEEIDFSNWRYVEPQYSYQIVEYSINLENSGIIDFTLYDQLQQLYVSIKQLEFVEREITEYSGLHKKLISDLPDNHPLNLERKADNSSNLDRFKLFIHSRAGNLRRVAANSTKALSVINDRLDLEKVKEIEREVIRTNIRVLESEEEAVKVVMTLFPNFSEGEIRLLYKEVKAEEEEQTNNR